MNVDQKILALETLLEKVRTNAAKPRPARGTAIATPQPTTAAARSTDDVAGLAVAAPPLRVPPVGVGTTKFGDDDWADTTETFETPVPLAAPLGSAAKDAAQKAAATAKPGPVKTTTPLGATKPFDPGPAKPAVATPAVAPVKPVVAPPTINKPAVTPAAVKPAVTTPAAKPTTPQNTPIPLTKPVAAPVIKTPTPIATPAVTKPAAIDPGIAKTLTGVGEGAVKAPEVRPEPLAVEPVLELEKKPVPAAAKSEPGKPMLPSADIESDGEEDAEPTQLYEASAASRRAHELAALAEKQLEEAKKSLGVEKKGESDKVEIRLPDAKAASDKSDKTDKAEVKVEAPKLDLPWVEKGERKPEADKISAPTPEDKLPQKAGPSQTELDLELVASQDGKDLEKVEVDVGEAKAEAKVEAKPVTPPPVLEEKPIAKPVAKPDVEPIPEKKPIVAETKPEPEKKPVVVTKPVVVAKPVVDEPVLEKPTQPSKGVPKLLIVAAAILLLAAGAFVAMKQGWISGVGSTPTPTVAPPTNPTPTAVQTAAPTTTQTAAQPSATNDTVAPPASASAAPADSAAAPADSAAAPADSAAAPADSAATPPASASAAATPPPAVAGTPSVDPATLNNNQGLIFVTSNKPARVYLTGKLAGETNSELKVDCGLKFVRLADPNQDISKPPMWLTPGQPQQIDCRKYTTFTVNVP